MAALRPPSCPPPTPTVSPLPCRCLRSGPRTARAQRDGVWEVWQIVPWCPHHGHTLLPETRDMLLAFYARAKRSGVAWKAAMWLQLDVWHGWAGEAAA